MPSPTPRPPIDQAFIDSIGSKCDDAFDKRVIASNLQYPLLTIKKYEDKWNNGDFNIPFVEAVAADEIKSLVCIITEDLERGTYEDGFKAYQQRWKIRLVDMETGSVAAEKSFAGDNPPNFKWGRGDAYGSSPDPQQIKDWIFAFFKLPVLTQKAAVDSLSFSPDGIYLAIGAGCDDTRLWNLKKMQALPVSTGKAEDCYTDYSTGYSPDGSVLAYFDDGYLNFKVFSGKFTQPNLDTTGLQSDLYVGFSPDGNSVAIGGYVFDGTGTVFIYDTKSGQNLLVISREDELEEIKYAAVLDNLQYSPDGKYLATSGMGQMMVFSPADGSLLFSLDTGYVEVNRPVMFGAAPEIMNKTARGIAFAPDGLSLAMGTANGEILIYSTQDWKETNRLSGHNSPVNALAFSPDGKFLASGGSDSQIILWQVDGWMKLDQLTGHLDEVTALAFSTDGTLLASGSLDKTVYLWDISK